ncbi:MAG: hypothetical protein HYZ44_10980 [Bacteroidetes bacterium]|nr:hypothetical protein [Bacteroidota bacterium]
MIIKLYWTTLILTHIIQLAFGQSNTIQGFNPNEELIEKKFFNKMILLIPKSYSRTGNKAVGEMFDIISFENASETVWFYIRKKSGEGNLDVAKTVHESMATSLYKGEIHKSEFRKINNRTVYIFEMTGYWNGSSTKESWTKIFTVDNGDLYQCLIKYPEKDRIPTQNIRDKIIASFKID